MTRAAFTSSCGDPFILMLCMKMFRERFYDEVDRYYINVNNHSGVPKEVMGELLSRLSQDPKVHIIYHPRGIGNGPPITEMTLVSKEDLIVLIEDDFFIFTPGVVSKHFQTIESDLTDALGSPRGSCGEEITSASAKRYGIDLTGYGDVGVNFWPSGFFCKRKDLLRTDLDFGSHTWAAGEYSKELDHTFKDINHGDTFVWACVQLRHLGLRFHNIPQYHFSPTEPSDQRMGAGNYWGGKSPYWVHGGSLSSGWSGYLSGQTPSVVTDGEKYEIESRVAFWQIALETTEGFNAFRIEYKNGIDGLIERANLDFGRIQSKYNLAMNMMKL